MKEITTTLRAPQPTNGEAMLGFKYGDKVTCRDSSSLCGSVGTILKIRAGEAAISFPGHREISIIGIKRLQKVEGQKN